MFIIICWGKPAVMTFLWLCTVTWLVRSWMAMVGLLVAPFRRRVMASWYASAFRCCSSVNCAMVWLSTHSGFTYVFNWLYSWWIYRMRSYSSWVAIFIPAGPVFNARLSACWQSQIRVADPPPMSTATYNPVITKSHMEMHYFPYGFGLITPW